MDFLLENILWVALACLSLSGISWTLRRESARSIEPSEAVVWLKAGKGIILDTRPAADFAKGGIPLSRNIPGSELEARAGELDKFRDRPVLVVCATGVSANKHVAQLTAKGFKQARVMRGGMAAWVQAQMPVFKK